MERSIKRTLQSIRRNWRLCTFMILPVAYILIFAYYPMFGLQIAFKDFQFDLGIWGSPWTGFDHFRRFFNSYQFERVISNTIILSAYSLVAGFPIPIIFALILNTMRSKRFKTLSENIAYVPHFISMVVLVGMIISLMNPRTGLIGNLYYWATGDRMRDHLATAAGFRNLYVWSGIWQNMGWNSIIYMAALAGVNTELYEAAGMDGATRFQMIRHIDIPSILPTMVILLILNSGSIMSIGFEKVFLMQNNLNLQASEVISTYVYKVSLAMGTGDFAYGTAIGLFNSLINFVILITVNQASKRWGETSLF